jgi:ABC-type sugar transport system ATPase subunit
MVTAVEFRDISKAYGAKKIADHLSFSAEANTFTVLFGAPGSGKSTLLRLLTGLDKPDSGAIWLRGKDASKMNPGERNIGYVPQSFALYPHYKVFDNIAYPLQLMGMPKSSQRPIVEQAAENLKISHLLDKKPDQLSGGEKQRVAIARGIVKHTDIFVLDDPLTGLDFKLREQLFDDLRAMRESLNATFVYTTSDALEVLMLAENIVVFDGGRAIESGELNAVYACPQHVRTMALLGYPEANLFDGALAGDGMQCQTPFGEFKLNGSAAAAGSKVKVAARPHEIRFNPSDDLLTFPAEIVLVEDLGSEFIAYLEAQQINLTAVVRHTADVDLSEGHTTVGIDPARLLVYDEAGRMIAQGANAQGANAQGANGHG